MIRFFTDIFESPGPVPVFFLVFFALVGFWVFHEYVKTWQLPIMRTRKRNLLQHDFFVNYARLKTAVNTFTVGNAELTAIFKIITKVKLDTVHNLTRDFVETQNWRKISNKELEQKVFQLLESIIRSYNKEILTRLQARYGKNKGRRVFDYVMNAPAVGFNHWHSTNVRHIESMTISIMASGIIKNACHKMHLILYELLFGLHSGVIDAERAFYGFNGQLATILEE